MNEIAAALDIHRTNERHRTESARPDPKHRSQRFTPANPAEQGLPVQHAVSASISKFPGKISPVLLLWSNRRSTAKGSRLAQIRSAKGERAVGYRWTWRSAPTLNWFWVAIVKLKIAARRI